MVRNAIGLVFLTMLASAAFAHLFGEDMSDALLTDVRQETATPTRQAASLTPSNGYSDIVRIPKARNGHFYTDLMVNRRSVNVLVDTGASVLALRDSDAIAAGLYPVPADYKHAVSTANGRIMAARMAAREVELGPLLVHNVEVLILPDESLDISLMGMNVLSEMGRVEFDQAELVIERVR